MLNQAQRYYQIVPSQLKGAQRQNGNDITVHLVSIVQSVMLVNVVHTARGAHTVTAVRNGHGFKMSQDRLLDRHQRPSANHMTGQKLQL